MTSIFTNKVLRVNDRGLEYRYDGSKALWSDATTCKRKEKDRELKGPADYRAASNSYPVKTLQKD